MQNKKILIVDDNATHLESLSLALETKFDCRTLAADSGQAALNIIESETVDLVLLDLVMDDMPGNEVVSKIRAKLGPDELPIIMVSARSDDDALIDCLKRGANDYITKPYNLEVAAVKVANQFELSDAIRKNANKQEALALKAISTTYNHKINNPLSIAVGSLPLLKKSETHEKAYSRIDSALGRITETVKQIQKATEAKVMAYEEYTGGTKILKLKD